MDTPHISEHTYPAAYGTQSIFHLIEKKFIQKCRVHITPDTCHPDLKIGTFKTISEVPKYHSVYTAETELKYV